MQANYANALCHLNATPLSVAVLAPCAWGENLVARQIRLGKRGESVAVLVGETDKAKMGQCLGGGLLSLSLSLVARTFWQAFGLNLKGFFTHFIVVSSRLIVNFSCFIVVFSRLFTYKRHFLGHCAFLKFLNALFLGFLRLSLRAIFAKTAHFLSF